MSRLWTGKWWYTWLFNFEVAAELEEDSREGEGTHKLLAKMPSALNGINP